MSRTACRHGKFLPLLAGSSLLAIGTLHANTEEDVASTTAASGSTGNVSLTNPPTGNPAPPQTYTDSGEPTATTDVTFPAAATYVGVVQFSIGKAYTFGSLNDLNSTPLTIVNGNGATQAPLTLMGGNSVAPSPADLIYVAPGSFLTFSKANTQSIVLGASGNFDVGTVLAVTANISGNFSLTKTGDGVLSLGNANTFTGPLTINAGSVQLGAGTNVGSITSNIVINNDGVTTSGSLVFNTSGAQSVASVISGAGTVTGINSGTTTLSGANTYSGATAINGGTLQFTRPAAMSAASAITVGSNGTLAVNAGGAGQFINATSGAGTIGGLFAGIGGQGNSITYSLGSTVGIDTTNAGATLTYAGNITNANVGVSKLGTGTLTLTGNNTYTGPTVVSAGILQAGSATAFGSGSAVFTANVAGATLDLNNNSMTIGSLSGGGAAGGNITLGTGTLTLGTDNTSPSPYASAITGTGGLIKVGTGTETLSGFSTFTGGTVVNGGTLALNAGGGTGVITGNVTVNTGGILSLTNQDALGFNTGTSVTTLNVNGGTVDEAVVPNVATQVSGNQGYLTNFNLTGGTVSSTGGGAFNFNVAAGAASPTITSNASATLSVFSGGIVIRNTGNLVFNVAAGTAGTTNGSDLTVSGVISQLGGVGGVSKAGAGILTFSAANTYGGATIVTAGTLATTGAGTLGTGNLTISGTGALTLGNSVSLTSAQTLNFAGTTRITLGTGTANTLANIVDTDKRALNPLTSGTTYSAAQLDAAFGVASFVGSGTLTVTAAVPEPSTWVCLALAGTCGFVLRRRVGVRLG